MVSTNNVQAPSLLELVVSPLLLSAQGSSLF
jgi:hypothetical protein